MRLLPASSFRGRFRLPGDKAVCHRLALMGAMATGETRVGRFSSGADCASTLRCLTELGVEIHREGSSVTIRGRGPDGLRAPGTPLDAGNSGSTLRMLAGVLAGRPFRSILTGDASLRRRPVERVAAPLRAMGARAEGTEGRPPLVIDGGSLHGIDWRLEVASAQVKTAILLAALQAEGTTTVREPLPSRDHTERLLPAFGASVSQDDGAVGLRGGQPLHGLDLEAPGDVSSAAFLVVAALIVPGSEVRIDGVLLNPRRTAFLDVLRRMGARLETGIERQDPEPVGWIEAQTSTLHGTEVAPEEVPGLIDEVPALAVAAARAEGRFTVRGAAELRVKESDRIATLATGLGRMGARIEELPDGLIVHGGPPLTGAAVSAQGDHRIAMALAVAALIARGPTEIDDAECASVSFPEFYDLLRRGCGSPA